MRLSIRSDAVSAEARNRKGSSKLTWAALLLVSRGEAPLGIVYKTDAVADKGVKIIGAFPDNTHPPIIYPIAAVAASTNPAGTGYIAFLRSPAAGTVFEKHGFTVLK